MRIPYRPLAAAIVLATTTAFAAPDVSDPGPDFVKLMAEYDAVEIESRADARNRYMQFQPRFAAFAEAHRGTDDEARALVWMLRGIVYTDRSTRAAETERLVKELYARHADSELIAPLGEMRMMMEALPGGVEAAYKPLLESPHRSVRAAGHYALGAARTRNPLPNRADHVAKLQSEYADVKFKYSTYGAIADGLLNPHSASALQVGQPAPEIEGVDENLKPMTLSSFKGKVVLLDFWGDW